MYIIIEKPGISTNIFDFAYNQADPLYYKAIEYYTIVGKL